MSIISGITWMITASASPFSKDDDGAKLCGEFSEYVKKIKSDGTLKAIDSVWFGTDESVKVIPDLSSLSSEKGTLSLAVEAANAPFVYIRMATSKNRTNFKILRFKLSKISKQPQKV